MKFNTTYFDNIHKSKISGALLYFIYKNDKLLDVIATPQQFIEFICKAVLHGFPNKKYKINDIHIYPELYNSTSNTITWNAKYHIRKGQLLINYSTLSIVDGDEIKIHSIKSVNRLIHKIEKCITNYVINNKEI